MLPQCFVWYGGHGREEEKEKAGGKLYPFLPACGGRVVFPSKALTFESQCATMKVI